MPGGELALQFVGQVDLYLTASPEVTWFRNTFKTYSNFACESIRVDFQRTDAQFGEKTFLRAKIPRLGDLVSSCYLVADIPAIYSGNPLRFRWAQFLGECMIDNCAVMVNGTVVDRHYGEWLHVWQQLCLNGEKRETYNIMTGNTSDMYEPEANNFEHRIFPLMERLYPKGIDPIKPSIRGKTLHIPLQWWFCRQFQCALPLIALAYSEVEILLELRPIRELYRLYYINEAGTNGYHAPQVGNGAHHIMNFVAASERRKVTPNDTVVNLGLRLEVNYIFLETAERSSLATKPMDSLIEVVSRIERLRVGQSSSVDLQLQGPIKEMVWVLRRSDRTNRNSWMDFTDNGRDIMLSAKFLFNGLERQQEKDATYYNSVVPWQHHSGSPKPGVYCMSFSLYPEQGHTQPSGSVNASRINKIQMLIRTRQPDDASYHYDLILFAVAYNFLRISNGQGGLLFAS
jgi:hypothetical protein